MPAASTTKLSVQVLDFEDIGLLIQLARLMRFLFVGPALCLQLPSDSASQWTPLPANYTPVELVGDFHPQVSAPCRAHKEKAPGTTRVRALEFDVGTSR
jgi:hypothetical protein